MASYLSEEWFEQVGAAQDQDATAGEVRLVIQHVVTGAPGGEVCYHVLLSRDGVTIVPGRAPRPDVTFAEDYATAAAIAAGRLAAPAALLAGDIRVGGDWATLIAHQDVLTAPDPIPASVRAETTF